jgi:hypothetical protein
MNNNGHFAQAIDLINGPTGTSRTRKSKHGRVVTCDLHGCSIPRALEIALMEIAERPPNCQKVNFIVGKGLHSLATDLLLRNALMDELPKHGYSCRLMNKNEGILEVFPFQIEKPMPSGRLPIVLAQKDPTS